MPRLLKISLIITITGILLLLFLSLNQKPLEITCSEINKFTLNGDTKVVSFMGFVLSEKEITKSFKTLNIASMDEDCHILATCNFCQNTNFQNSTIKIIGSIELYQEKPEIIADEITVLKR